MCTPEETHAQNEDLINLCTVCLDPIDDDASELSTFPGCKHKFHCACMLNFAQYDVRCPTCRQMPTGVTVRSSEEGDDEDESDVEMETLREELRIAQRSWNAYEARRRKCIRRNASMRQAASRVRQMHADITATNRELHRCYDAKCKLIWKTDNDVQTHKKKLTRLHRVKRRVQLKLESDVVAIIGSRPQVLFL